MPNYPIPLVSEDKNPGFKGILHRVQIDNSQFGAVCTLNTGHRRYKVL